MVQLVSVNLFFFVFISLYALWVGLNDWFLVGLMQYIAVQKKFVRVEKNLKKFACRHMYTSVKMINFLNL